MTGDDPLHPPAPGDQSEYAVAPSLMVVHDPTEFDAFAAAPHNPGELLESYLYRERPDIQLLRQQHHEFVRILRQHTPVVYLSELLAKTRAEKHFDCLRRNPNHVFTRDAWITVPWIPDGYIAARMKKPIRQGEPAVMVEAAATLGLHEIVRVPPNLSLEGGDVMPWCRDGRRTLIVGCGPRTSPEIPRFLRDALLERGLADSILAVNLAEWRLNLDGCFFVVSPDTIVTNLDSILGGMLLDESGDHPVQPVGYFKDLGFRVIEATRDESFLNQACNFACLGSGILVAYSMTERINEQLRDLGLRVLSFSGGELVKGNGGPHCMTRPVYQSAVSVGT